MKISTKSKNAVAIVSYLACFEKNTVVPMSLIEKDLKISKTYMAQILILLKENGIADTKKGVNGGYFISENADFTSLTVGDICRSVEKNMYVSECVFDPEMCELKKEAFSCPSRNVLCDISDAVFDVLDNYYIKDISEKLKQQGFGIMKQNVKENENETVGKKQVWNTWLD